MDIERLSDKDQITAFLERDPYLNIYALGDLDDFFWPYTTWFGLRHAGELRAIVLVYHGPGVPTVVAVSSENEPLSDLVVPLLGALPDRFYAHLNVGLCSAFEPSFLIQSGGLHYKMSLHAAPASSIDTSAAERLGRGDQADLEALYSESYPGNWFDPRMLETGEYFGIREDDRLVSAAGIHVYSKRYRVAALGNIVTRPERRGQGYGTQVTAALCDSLYRKNIRTGLNVRADNQSAITSYRKIGFEVTAPYEEYLLSRKAGT